ncbi:MULTISPECIES: nucleoside triphosphate pyrophosphatase [unclassified Thioalkalivibrio]|uniref:Maf family protein n=1 Tax=unclassified Thioalkalivibrio TaxID=2621013 RepID=UPI00036CEFDC|nr:MULTISPECIES: Maf family protein [unclassified Thioalkalivibrio]
MPSPERSVILASTSPYRAQLLQRLALPFGTDAPTVDEQPYPGEAPADLVRRLAEAKARAVSGRHGDALIIGSDQNAAHAGRILGKPGDETSAREQLAMLSGGTVTFHTGLCLLDTATGEAQVEETPCRVTFRDLDAAEIAAYVRQDQPLDCAGSFRSEGLGISLFERMDTEDPTALVGLPLIRLAALLRAAGVSVPPRT